MNAKNASKPRKNQKPRPRKPQLRLHQLQKKKNSNLSPISAVTTHLATAATNAITPIVVIAIAPLPADVGAIHLPTETTIADVAITAATIAVIIATTDSAITVVDEEEAPNPTATKNDIGAIVDRNAVRVLARRIVNTLADLD